MSKEELSFLEEEAEAEAPEAVEPDPVEEPEKAEATEEAPEAEPEPTGEKEAETPPVQQEAQHIPITALLDEREKRQEFERRAAEMERKVKEFERKLQEQQKPEAKAPDMFEDPEAYQRHQQQQVQSGFWNQTLNTSEMVARSQHGAEVVEAATQAFMEAAQSNPGLQHELRAQQHPYQFVIDWHKRQQVLEQVGTDPEAYKAKIREEIMAELQGSKPAQQSAPPKSVVSAPSAGREAPPVKGETFDQLFGH